MQISLKNYKFHPNGKQKRGKKRHLVTLSGLSVKKDPLEFGQLKAHNFCCNDQPRTNEIIKGTIDCNPSVLSGVRISSIFIHMLVMMVKKRKTISLDVL